jgi:D-alanyl-D-alanine dipeptidase
VHNRGCAVDLTIVNTATNLELKMPTPFDDFTEKAGHSYIELSDTVLKNRALLREIMEEHGFQIYNYEWWHYNFNEWQSFQLMDIPFEQLVK